MGPHSSRILRGFAVCCLPLFAAARAPAAEPARASAAEAAAVAALRTAVEELIAEGAAVPQAGRWLTAPLDRAGRAARGSRAAGVSLRVFATRVETLVARGTLSAEQGRDLVTAADSLSQSMQQGRGRAFDFDTGGAGAARGDFNGDGVTDLAIGAPLQDVGGTRDAGEVFVLHGTAEGLTATGGQAWTLASAGAGDAQEFDRFGAALAAADFDRDGYADLAIGVPGRTVALGASGEPVVEAGAVVIVHGSATGLAAGRTEVLSLVDVPGMGAALRTYQERARFGAVLAWADFDGDGTPDLAVGAPAFTAAPPGAAMPVLGAGLVAVFHGTPGGFRDADGALVRAARVLSPAGSSVDEDLVADRADAGDRFGAALAGGDFDGDGFADLAIGRPSRDAGSLGSLRDAGALHVVYGGASGLDGAAAQTFNLDDVTQGGAPMLPARAGDRFGSALRAADFDGDGRADLAVGIALADVARAQGSPAVDAGAVVVLYGATAGGLASDRAQLLTQASAAGDPAVDETPEANDRFGAALAAGDFDGDGFKDLAVGAPLEDLADRRGRAVRDCGVVHVYHGSAGGLSGTPRLLLRAAGALPGGTAAGTTPVRAGDRFGAALTSWNFGRGARADLVVGVPGADLPRAPNAGRVQVLYGSDAGLEAEDSPSFDAGSAGFPAEIQRNAAFGSALY